MKLLYVMFAISYLSLLCSGEENNGKRISSSYSYSLEYNDSDHGNFGHRLEVKDGTAKVNVRSENPKNYSPPVAQSPTKHSQNIQESPKSVPVQKNEHHQPQLQHYQTIDATKYSREQLAVLLAQNKNPFLPLDQKNSISKFVSKPTDSKSQYYAHQNGQTQQVYYQPQVQHAYAHPVVYLQNTGGYSAPQSQNEVQYVYVPQSAQSYSPPQQSYQQNGPIQFSHQTSAQNSEKVAYVPNYTYNQVQPNYAPQEKLASSSDHSSYGVASKSSHSGQVANSPPKDFVYSHQVPNTQSAQVKQLSSHSVQSNQPSYSAQNSGQVSYKSSPTKYTLSNQVQPSSYPVQGKHSTAQTTYVPPQQYAYYQPTASYPTSTNTVSYKPQAYQNLDHNKLVQYVPSNQDSSVVYKPSETVQHSTNVPKYSPQVRPQESSEKPIDFASLFPGFKFDPTSQYLGIQNAQEPYYHQLSNQVAHHKIPSETNQKLQYQPTDVNALTSSHNYNVPHVSVVQGNDKYGQYSIDYQQGLGASGAQQVMVQTHYNSEVQGEQGSAPAAAEYSNVRYVYVPTHYVPHTSTRNEQGH